MTLEGLKHVGIMDSVNKIVIWWYMSAFVGVYWVFDIATLFHKQLRRCRHCSTKVAEKHDVFVQSAKYHSVWIHVLENFMEDNCN
jgi:hypothetical protein